MHRTSSGSSGTHIRPRGDVLAHRMPCVHDTSSILEKHLLMNQTSPRVLHKDSRAHKLSKPPPTDPYIGNRPWDPPSSHPHERWCIQSRPRIGRPHRSVEPTLRRFTLIFHMSSPRWILRAFPWCLGCSRVLTRAYE
jgi:hypothetical protein